MPAKSSTERQLRYQERRKANEQRISVWLSHELVSDIDTIRGDTARADFVRRAIERAILEQTANELRPVASQAPSA